MYICRIQAKDLNCEENLSDAVTEVTNLEHRGIELFSSRKSDTSEKGYSQITTSGDQSKASSIN